MPGAGGCPAPSARWRPHCGSRGLETWVLPAGKRRSLRGSPTAPSALLRLASRPPPPSPLPESVRCCTGRARGALSPGRARMGHGARLGRREVAVRRGLATSSRLCLDRLPSERQPLGLVPAPGSRLQSLPSPRAGWGWGAGAALPRLRCHRRDPVSPAGDLTCDACVSNTVCPTCALGPVGSAVLELQPREPGGGGAEGGLERHRETRVIGTDHLQQLPDPGAAAITLGGLQTLGNRPRGRPLDTGSSRAPQSRPTGLKT